MVEKEQYIISPPYRKYVLKMFLDTFRIPTWKQVEMGFDHATTLRVSDATPRIPGHLPEMRN